MSEQEYKNYGTEAVNKKSYNIDKMSSLDMVRLINDEDKTVAEAITPVLPEIAEAIDEIAVRLTGGGRLIYIGAGTSGRLGVIDATECPPTYGVSPELIQGVIAGGRDAMFRSSEGTEDSAEAAVVDLKNIEFSNKDICFGISASGSAAYVCSAIEYAKGIGALTVSLSCNALSRSAKLADIAINPLTGPEVISGSTRMKAGTATKLVLNMISTGVMVKMGRVWHNLMVCMSPSNKKLLDRAARIICSETKCDYETAISTLNRCNGIITDAIKNINN